MNPYENLPSRAFWAPAIAQKSMFEIDGLWDPKFEIEPSTRVVTYGSCFAQHIGRALKQRGFNWHVTERAPWGLKAESKHKFNYDVFSSRTGNIYTTSLLRQWAAWALHGEQPPGEIWRVDSRYIDPFRPNIEPDGFESEAELLASRAQTVDAFRSSIITADVFVFTLGLTESWFNSVEGYEYPTCPGTLAGDFDGDRHAFVAQEYDFVRANLSKALLWLKDANPKLKVILTISPVPLTATRSGNHVLVATIESKSVLRAVAGSLSRAYDFVDYFPSFEIISSPPFRGTFFEANQRSVAAAGVRHVMNVFFRSQEAKFGVVQQLSDTESARSDVDAAQITKAGADDVVCEEALLEAFATSA